MNKLIIPVIIKCLEPIKKKFLAIQGAAHQAHTSFTLCSKVNFINNII